MSSGCHSTQLVLSGSAAEDSMLTLRLAEAAQNPSVVEARAASCVAGQRSRDTHTHTPVCSGSHVVPYRSGGSAATRGATPSMQNCFASNLFGLRHVVHVSLGHVEQSVARQRVSGCLLPRGSMFHTCFAMLNQHCNSLFARCDACNIT